MGIIRRQGLKTLVASYLGMGLGLVNVLVLYPKFLEPAEFGLVRVLTQSAMLFMGLAQLGLPNLAVRFFPEFRNPSAGHHGFLMLLMLYPLLGGTLFTALFFGFKDGYISAYEDQSPLLVGFYAYVPLYMFLMLYYQVFESYAKVHARVALPVMLREAGWRLGNGLLVLGVGLGVLQLIDLLNGLVLVYLLALLALVGYLMANGWFHWRPAFAHLSKPLLRRMLNFGVITSLSGISVRLANRIDILMIPAFLGLEPVAIYSVALMIGSVLRIPGGALMNISAPFLSDALHRRDFAELQKRQNQTSRMLFFAGLLIGGGILLNIADFYSLMGPEKGAVYREGIPLVGLLTLNFLLQTSSAFVNQLLLHSDRYRLHFYINLGAALFNIGLNVLLIPLLGLTGVAVATLASGALKVSLMGWLVWRFYGINPLPPGLVSLLGLALGAALLAFLLPLPTTWSPMLLILNIVTRGLAFALPFGLAVYHFRLVPDLNDFIAMLLRRVGLRR